MVPVVFSRRSESSGDGAGPRLNVVAIAVLVASLGLGGAGSASTGNPLPFVVMLVVGLVLMQAPRVAQQWERVAQTALRDIIGRTTLTELLRGRERIEADLQTLIDQRSNPWGVTVSSVEMRDIVIPGALQDAMSREAQASREKQARIILGEAEMEIAHSFAEAAKSYQHNPTALHLRAMNMLYEGLKEKGALMLIPSSAVESMGMGGLMGAAAMRQTTLTGGESAQNPANPAVD